jgi:DNA polymerase-3 subunit delta
MAWHKFQDFLDKYRLSAFPALLCLFGSDIYLRKLLVSAVEKKFGNGKKVERESYYASETGPENVLAAARTYSMFSQQKLIIVHQFQAWPQDQRATALSYLEKPNPSTIMILIADDPPEDYGKKKEYSKWFDSAEDKIEIVDLTALWDPDIRNLTNDMAGNMGKRISKEAADLLMELVGKKPELIQRELEKICLSIGESKNITPEMVHEMVMGNRLQSIFEFTDSLGKRDFEKALRIYHKMREQNPSTEMYWYINTLNMIKRHYRILLETNAVLGSEQNIRQAMERNRISPMYRKDYISQAGEFPRQKLLDFFDQFYAFELEMWSSKIGTEIIQTVTDSNILMEKLILDLCRL